MNSNRFASIFKGRWPFAILGLFLLFCSCSRQTAKAADAMPAVVADGAKLVEEYGNGQFYEGPSWDRKGGHLYFSATPDEVLRLDAPGKATVVRKGPDYINGTFYSNDGRLLCVGSSARSILSYRIGADRLEDEKVLAANAKWRSPNDICQSPQGFIYFSDPDFSHTTDVYVYCINPKGEVKVAAGDMGMPNGVLASNDGKILYVSDDNPHPSKTATHYWYAYRIQEDGSLGKRSVFFKSIGGVPDGMTIDAEGNLYLPDGPCVWVVAKSGKALGKIEVPEVSVVTNCTFGGTDAKTLYMTCSLKVFSLKMKVRRWK